MARRDGAGAQAQGRKVNYAVSSQSVFTRFVKLPSVGEEQVDQIVTFEAQQNVPYPIDEVVWDYQLVDSGDSSQVEVVIVAIKSDLLDEINESVEASGAEDHARGCRADGALQRLPLQLQRLSAAAR